MHPNFIRSTLFNLLFYVLTALSCIALLPTLVLPRRYYMAVVYGFVNVTWFLEKYVLGLNFVIKGIEHMPQSGAFIVACKHLSAYETFKLHILFKDPSVILKKELLKIPLWGKYLQKSDVIAIDRSTPKDAVRSIQEGAKRVAAQGRPIIIFPQGTRVLPDTPIEKKPYKIGVMRVQEATGLPIIPIATNTGAFYPKKGWSKHQGVITFEILPPMEYDPDADIGKQLKMLETNVENASNALIEDAHQQIEQRKKKSLLGLLLILFFLGMTYTAYWFYAANKVEEHVKQSMLEIKNNPNVSLYVSQPPQVSGFPGKINVTLPTQIIAQNDQSVEINKITATGWPIPFSPIDIHADTISLTSPFWSSPITLDNLKIDLTYGQDDITLTHAEISSGRTKAIATGYIKNLNAPYPEFNIALTLQKHEEFLTMLLKSNAINQDAGAMLTFALQALNRKGAIQATLKSDKNRLFLGPLQVYEFPLIIQEETPKRTAPY